MKTTGGVKTFQWQDGYAALAVSEAHVEAIKNYISNQKEHHEKKEEDFKGELIRILKAGNVDFDERYLWI